MCERSLSVWFVCRLCRGSFGQVDAFIEHKKQKHFTQFQNTTSIVFEESEQGLQYPVMDHQLQDEINDPVIKIEVNDEDEDPINPFSSELMEEPNLDLFEPQSELITYESDINPDNESSFFGLDQPELNPFVLVRRLTSEEIQSACVIDHHSAPRLTNEQKNIINGPDAPNSCDSESKITGQNDGEKPTEIPSTSTVRISTEDDRQFECKLCSMQLQSEAQLKIHVGICALHHKYRNRFCVICNRKFYDTKILKRHRLSFHGTEEEKLSLRKFKCQLCPKQYRQAIRLRFHLKSHEETKDQVEISNLKLLMCSHPNCGKEFRCNSELQRHVAIHLDLRPFSCSFPNCNKRFRRSAHLKKHSLTHTG